MRIENTNNLTIANISMGRLSPKIHVTKLWTYYYIEIENRRCNDVI